MHKRHRDVFDCLKSQSVYKYICCHMSSACSLTRLTIHILLIFFFSIHIFCGPANGRRDQITDFTDSLVFVLVFHSEVTVDSILFFSTRKHLS